LQRNGYNAEVVVVHISDKPSKDFTASLEKLGKGKKAVIDIKKTADIPDFPDNAIIIDAIFGIGLNRPSEGIGREVIEKINQSKSTVISIDMPSGLFDADNAKNDPKGIIRSDHILTFQLPKLSFFLSENETMVGEVHVLDIGLHPDFLKQIETTYHYLTGSEAAAMRKS